MFQILKLRDWINPKKLNFVGLSANTNAIELLKQNISEIQWDCLSLNINAIELLKQNYNKINWYELSCKRVFQKTW